MGTTTTKVVIVDAASGVVLASKSEPSGGNLPCDDHNIAEQDPGAHIQVRMWVCVGLCGSVWVCVGLCGSV